MNALLCGHDPKVLKAIGLLLAGATGSIVDEPLHLAACSTSLELARIVEGGDAWTMACVDIGSGEGMEYVFKIRSLCQGAGLLLVVDEGVSPVTYIRPGVMPSALVQRPVTESDLRSIVDEFVRYLLLDSTEADDAQCFTFEGKAGVVRVPYRSILAFEARSKRIFARLRREEYGFYDTLDKLSARLPDGFVRCHRSFIVNIARVRRLNLATAEAILDDDTRIPVSRSYRQTMREVLS